MIPLTLCTTVFSQRLTALCICSSTLASFLLQSLLSLRKQQAVACLGFSCDWLAHKLLKISAAIKHQPASAPIEQSSNVGAKSSGLNRTGDPDRRKSSAADGAVAPAEKLRQIARKLSQLADDSLLCLRLEVSLRTVLLHTAQIPAHVCTSKHMLHSLNNKIVRRTSRDLVSWLQSPWLLVQRLFNSHFVC